MAKRRNHLLQLQLRLLPRHSGDESDDTRHGSTPLGGFYFAPQFAVIPGAPKFAKLGSHGFGKTIE